MVRFTYKYLKPVALIILILPFFSCGLEDYNVDPILTIENNKITCSHCGYFAENIVTDQDHVLISSLKTLRVFQFDGQIIEMIQTITPGGDIRHMAANNKTLAIAIVKDDIEMILIYSRSEDLWEFKQEIPAIRKSWTFGRDIDIDGDLMVVGDNGYQMGYGTVGDKEGRVYVYRKINEKWTFEKEFRSSHHSINDAFGKYVAVYKNIILAGSESTLLYIYKNDGKWELFKTKNNNVTSISHSGNRFLMFSGNRDFLAFNLELDGRYTENEINFEVQNISENLAVNNVHAIIADSDQFYLLKYENDQWQYEMTFNPHHEYLEERAVAITDQYVIIGGDDISKSGTSYVYFLIY